MSYNWDGLMELLGGKYRPTWTNPCGGDDVKGNMELDSGKYKPVSDSYGLCAEKSGVMELDSDSGKYYPRIVLEDEQTCCAGTDCSDCGWIGNTPKIMKVTVEGVTEAVCSEGDPNGEYYIEQDSEYPCRWAGEGGLFRIEYYAYGYGAPPTVTVIIMKSILNPEILYFQRTITPHCIISFDNSILQSECCTGDPTWAAAYGGTAVLTCEPI